MTPWEQIQSDAGHRAIYKLGSRQLLSHELSETLRTIAKLTGQEGESGSGVSDSEQNNAAAIRESHARSVFGAVQTALITLNNCSQPGIDDLLNLAVSLEYLEYLKTDGVFQSADEAQAMVEAQAHADRIAGGWLESGVVAEPLSGHLRKVAQGLIDVLQPVQRVGNDRLFVRYEIESAVQADRMELSKLGADLKKREAELLEIWRKTEEELKRIGIQGDAVADEVVRSRLKSEASEQGSEGKAAQALSKIADLESRQRDVALRARQLVEEEAKLCQDASEREAKLGDISSICQLDARRNFLLQGFDPVNIDPDSVKQARAVLSGKLNSLDEKIQEYSAKVPAECLDPSGEGVSPLFCCLNRVWKLNRRQEYHAMLDRSDLCEFLFKTGAFYFETVNELQTSIESLQALLDEHARQVVAVQEIKDLVKKGAVFQAEKRMTKIERKFKGVSYRRCDEAIQEASRPLREAKRLSTEVDDYLSKRKGLMGKLFKDKDTRRKLDTEISRIWSETANLPKYELREEVSALCQKLESALKG